MILIESWRKHYNEVRPHSSIDYMTPNEFKKQNLTPLGGALLAQLVVRRLPAGHIDAAGFTRRSPGFAEASRLEYLPALHSDPFDRMPIAHALEEGAAIVTKDEQIARYPVRVIR